MKLMQYKNVLIIQHLADAPGRELGSTQYVKQWEKVHCNPTELWLLFVCKIRTINKKMKKKVRATEMWFWRQIWHMWTGRKTDEKVLYKPAEQRQLIKTIRKTQPQLFNHSLNRAKVKRLDGHWKVQRHKKDKENVRKKKVCEWTELVAQKKWDVWSD